MAEPFILRDEALVRFVDIEFHSRAIHWQSVHEFVGAERKVRNRWLQIPCTVFDCPHCLAAGAVQVRYTATVMHDEKVKSWEFTRKVYVLVKHHLDLLGPALFLDATFAVSRHGRGMDSAYSMRVVS